MLNIAYLNTDTMTVHEFESLLPYFCEERRLYLSECRNEKVKFESAAGEGLARLMLAKALSVKPETLRFERMTHGKPYLSGISGLYFNWSHSRGHVLCAVSDSDIGADIQIKLKAIHGIDKRILSENEKKCTDPSAADYIDFITKIWCKKESFYKMLGTGIDRRPSETDTVELTEDRSCNWLEGEIVPGVYWAVCRAKETEDASIMQYSAEELLRILKEM